MATTVKKSHHLITAGFSLSAREQDIVTLIFKALKRSADDVKFSKDEGKSIQTEFTFSLNQLMEHFSLSRQGLYDMLDVATNGIMGKVASVKDIEKQSFEKFSLCTYARFEDGVLILRVDSHTARHMLDYTKGYAEIDFKLSLALTGEYEKRLLDIISRFKVKDFTCSLGEFYRMFDTSPKDYRDFDSFRKTVIERPLKRLIQRSDGMWQAADDKKLGYQLDKVGRSYKDTDKITFKMKFNEPKSLVLPKKREKNSITNHAEMELALNVFKTVLVYTPGEPFPYGVVELALIQKHKEWLIDNGCNPDSNFTPKYQAAMMVAMGISY